MVLYYYGYLYFFKEWFKQILNHCETMFRICGWSFLYKGKFLFFKSFFKQIIVMKNLSNKLHFSNAKISANHTYKEKKNEAGDYQDRSSG